jgi:hypothetical protein
MIAKPTTTIADLEDSGLRLGINCLDCGRFRYVVTKSFVANAVISNLQLERTCTRCRSDNIEFRPVHRDATTGFWPAENG